MSNSVSAMRSQSALRLRQLRQQAGLRRVDLAALSHVGLEFIGAFENDHLSRLISDHEIWCALLKSFDDGSTCLMQRTLMRWAEELHRLADALAETFENLFPADDLAAISDDLWLKIQVIKHHIEPDPQPLLIWPANPWHEWGWFRNVSLSDDLLDDTPDDPVDADDLDPAIRALVANLGSRERLVLTLHYGLDGPDFSLHAISRQLGLTVRDTSRLERRALRRLKNAFVQRHVHDVLDQ